MPVVKPADTPRQPGAVIDADQSPRTVVVALDHHFVRVGDEVYTELACGRAYWQEYLEVFDRVIVFARVGTADRVPAETFRADGPNVTFHAIPDYLGPAGLARACLTVARVARRTSATDASFILRNGSVSTCLWPWLLLRGKSYAREVQGFVGTAIREATRQTHGTTGPLFAKVSEWLTRLEVKHASAASYVSEACRDHYPTAARHQEFVFSSVELTADLITAPRASDSFSTDPFRIVSVGRLEHEKGHHVLIDAVAKLVHEQQLPIEITLIGGGRSAELLRQRAADAGIADRVDLVGPVQRGSALFSRLDQADLFVLPSLTEGMPRALIEAMARGLPVVGSRVGGVPELLNHEAMVEPDDAAGLARAISVRARSRDRLAAESASNFHLAVERYSRERMRERKHAFWQATRRALTRAA